MPTAEQVTTAYARMISRCELSPGPLDTPCLVYTGATDPDGYACVRVGDSMMPGHRLAELARHGSIEPGLNVLHHCDYPPCVAEGHLWRGTQAENLADMRAKGRARPNTARGEDSGRAKLTAAEVQEIRGIAGCFSQAAIAAEYGISQVHVGRIIRGEAWEHTIDNDKENHGQAVTV